MITNTAESNCSVTLGGIFILKFKIFLCVFVADTADYLAKGFTVIGIFTVFDPCADKITEYSAEIFVSRIGNKAT